MKKIISIVIPTYNVEKYLDRCIRSLTFNSEILDDIEIIIVNDGSKDNSLLIAKKYEKEFPKSVLVIDKENGGHGSTINEGLKVASGKYFKVIDSDDWVNIDDMVNFVESLKKLDVDMVVTNYQQELVYESRNFIFNYKPIEYNQIYDFDKFDFNIIKPNYFAMHAITYKTEMLRDCKLYLDEKTFYVDMEYILLPITHVKTFTYLDYNIYRYFIGRPDQSVNIKSMVKNRKNHEKVLKRLIDFYNTAKLSKSKKEYVRYILDYMLNTEYNIFTKAKLPSKKDKKEIKQFDKYLKKNCNQLYDDSSKMFTSIRWNRKTKFCFAQTKRFMFSRLADFRQMRQNNRRLNKEAQK